MQRNHCANDNHGRSVVTVRCCPSCGGIVNVRILAKTCPTEEHERRRRARSTYCVNCGERLIQGGMGR